MTKPKPTSTPAVHPEGMRPEEFLRDEDLAVYHEQRLAAALEDDPNHPDRAELERAARSARKAAALTAEAVAEAEAEAQRELAQQEVEPA